MHVLIATHQRPRLLARTLESLSRAVIPSEEVRVLVVENGSPPTSAAVCRAADLPVDYHHHGEPGKSRALNSGLERIGSGFVLFLDDDLHVSEDLFTAYQAASCGGGNRAIYGGPVLPEFVGSPPSDWLMPFLPPSVRGFHPKGDAPFLGGNFGLFAEEALEAGGFDHRLGVGSLGESSGSSTLAEETELQKRMVGMGFGLVPVPDARVWHFIPEERCSPEWALNRQYRDGLTSGFLRALTPKGRSLGGVPFWIWKMLAYGVPKWILGSLLRPGERRFKLQVQMHYAVGYLRGTRMGRPWLAGEGPPPD